MKKIAISLLVLALVAAFSATGVVSAATCAATTTTCPSTTSAQCTSCTTSCCCCCPPPKVECCCPVVTCCVVTKCCEVKAEAKAAAWVHPPVYPWVHPPVAGAVATDGAAATTGGQAVNQQVAQENNAAVAIDGDNNLVETNQGNIAGQIAVPIQIKDVTINPAIAWNGGQAAADGSSIENTETEIIA